MTLYDTSDQVIYEFKSNKMKLTERPTSQTKQQKQQPNRMAAINKQNEKPLPVWFYIKSLIYLKPDFGPKNTKHMLQSLS